MTNLDWCDLSRHVTSTLLVDGSVFWATNSKMTWNFKVPENENLIVRNEISICWYAHCNEGMYQCRLMVWITSSQCWQPVSLQTVKFHKHRINRSFYHPWPSLSPLLTRPKRWPRWFRRVDSLMIRFPILGASFRMQMYGHANDLHKNHRALFRALKKKNQLLVEVIWAFASRTL